MISCLTTNVSFTYKLLNSFQDVIELPYAPTLVSADRVPSTHKAVNVSWTPGENNFMLFS
jgi:hypothetical protein